jgi:hypothetical protein
MKKKCEVVNVNEEAYLIIADILQSVAEDHGVAVAFDTLSAVVAGALSCSGIPLEQFEKNLPFFYSHALKALLLSRHSNEMN